MLTNKYLIVFKNILILLYIKSKMYDLLKKKMFQNNKPTMSINCIFILDSNQPKIDTDY